MRVDGVTNAVTASLKIAGPARTTEAPAPAAAANGTVAKLPPLQLPAAEMGFNGAPATASEHFHVKIEIDVKKFLSMMASMIGDLNSDANTGQLDIKA